MGEECGMFTVHQTMGSVLCCKCGIRMQPNTANMCVNCLRSEIDITEGLPKQQQVVVHCPECESYLHPPRTWVKLQLESKELLSFCLKKLEKNMKVNRVKLVHAEFVWTEPHSKRIKIKLKVQKEVLNGAILEHSYVVEYVQQEHMCDSCSRVQANPDQWVAVVQLRQHVSHKRTFFNLERLILKHGVAAKAVIRIKQMDQGIDFFFSNRSHAVKFVEFIAKVAPVRTNDGTQLVSHDSKSGTYIHKYSFSVEISPICREDLICLSPELSHTLGNLGPLVICTKVTNTIALLDPYTLRQCFLNADQYWRTSFKPLLTSRQLVEYIVLDLDVVSSEIIVGGTKYVLADAQVARLSDFGKNDMIFNIRTHLGHLLNPGDYALGYDLFGANNNDIELDNYRGFVLPDSILVNKCYKDQRPQKSNYKVKVVHSEYQQFLEDLQENPRLRFNISLADGELPSPSLEDLLADLELDEDEDEDMVE